MGSNTFNIQRVKVIFTHFILIIFGFIWVYPFLWTLSTSFKTDGEIFRNGLSLIPENLILSNYYRAWTTANFGTYFVNTVFVSVVTVAIILLMTAGAGYALGRYRFSGRKVIFAVLAATMFLPAGYTIIPIYDLIRTVGLMNTLSGVMLVIIGVEQVIFILLFAGYFKQIPRDLQDAAEIDGCGYWTTFFKVMFPIAKPVSASVIIMQFISSWNAFLVPLVFTLNKPNLRTVGVGIYAFKSESSMDWTGMAAGAIISIVPIIIVFLFMQKYFIEGIAGAVKN